MIPDGSGAIVEFQEPSFRFPFSYKEQVYGMEKYDFPLQRTVLTSLLAEDLYRF